MGGKRQPSTVTKSGDCPYFFQTSSATCLRSCSTGDVAGLGLAGSLSGVTSDDFGIAFSGGRVCPSISGIKAGFSSGDGLAGEPAATEESVPVSRIIGGDTGGVDLYA